MTTRKHKNGTQTTTKKYVEKYNKFHLEKVINKNNCHNNTLSYSVPAILEVTSTLNPGNHVLAIFKTFVFLCHLHLSFFKCLPKYLIY